MINLLPPELKNQIAFAKRNATLVRYFRALIIAAIVLALVVTGSDWFVKHRLDQAAHDLADRMAKIATYSTTEQNAKNLQDQLQAISQVQQGQTHFSTLLQELATLTPAGVSWDSLNLSSDNKKPSQITVTANSFAAISGFRDALASSKRVQGVDIENITNPSAGAYKAQLDIAFKPGATR